MSRSSNDIEIFHVPFLVQWHCDIAKKTIGRLSRSQTDSQPNRLVKRQLQLGRGIGIPARPSHHAHTHTHTHRGWHWHTCMRARAHTHTHTHTHTLVRQQFSAARFVVCTDKVVALSWTAKQDLSVVLSDTHHWLYGYVFMSFTLAAKSGRVERNSGHATRLTLGGRCRCGLGRGMHWLTRASTIVSLTPVESRS